MTHHTEQQAAHMACPLREARACLGKTCMAWRWSSTEYPRFTGCRDEAATTEPERPTWVSPTWVWVGYDVQEGEPAGWREPDDECQARRTGYCGMVPPIPINATV